VPTLITSPLYATRVWASRTFSSRLPGRIRDSSLTEPTSWRSIKDELRRTSVPTGTAPYKHHTNQSMLMPIRGKFPVFRPSLKKRIRPPRYWLAPQVPSFGQPPCSVQAQGPGHRTCRTFLCGGLIDSATTPSHELKHTTQKHLTTLEKIPLKSPLALKSVGQRILALWRFIPPSNSYSCRKCLKPGYGASAKVEAWVLVPLGGSQCVPVPDKHSSYLKTVVS
jgi:hypothetical protein